MTLAPGLVITNQSIGDALSFDSFDGVDGIIGVGPVGLTQGTVTPDTNTMIPTVMNNLVSQRLVEKQVLGVYFAPPKNYSDKSEFQYLDVVYIMSRKRCRWCNHVRRHRLELGMDTILVLLDAYSRLAHIIQTTSEVSYVPLTTTYPASHYWGINITSSTYGDHSVIPTSTAGVVDSGTTCTFFLFFFPSCTITITHSI